MGDDYEGDVFDMGEFGDDDYDGDGIGDLINKFINKLPVELHLPRHAFTGPGTKVDERLIELNKFKKGTINPKQCKFKRCSVPLNRIDEAAMAHDIAYNNTTSKEDRWPADKALMNTAFQVLKKPKNLREKMDARFVYRLMSAKLKLKL